MWNISGTSRCSFLIQFSFTLQNLLFLVHLKSIFQPEEWNVAFSCFLLLTVPTKSKEDVGESGIVIYCPLLVLAVTSLWLQWGAARAVAQHCWGPACDALEGVGAVTGQEPPPPWRKQIAVQFPWVRSQAALNLNLRASPPNLVVLWASHVTGTFTLFASLHFYAFSLIDLFFSNIIVVCICLIIWKQAYKGRS